VGNPRVRLKLRDGLRARWYTGTAHLLSDMTHANAKVARESVPSSASMPPRPLLRYSLLTVRIDLDS